MNLNFLPIAKNKAEQFINRAKKKHLIKKTLYGILISSTCIFGWPTICSIFDWSFKKRQNDKEQFWEWDLKNSQTFRIIDQNDTTTYNIQEILAHNKAIIWNISSSDLYSITEHESSLKTTETIGKCISLYDDFLRNLWIERDPHAISFLWKILSTHNIWSYGPWQSKRDLFLKFLTPNDNSVYSQLLDKVADFQFPNAEKKDERIPLYQYFKIDRDTFITKLDSQKFEMYTGAWTLAFAIAAVYYWKVYLDEWTAIKNIENSYKNNYSNSIFSLQKTIDNEDSYVQAMNKYSNSNPSFPYLMWYVLKNNQKISYNDLISWVTTPQFQRAKAVSDRPIEYPTKQENCRLYVYLQIKALNQKVNDKTLVSRDNFFQHDTIPVPSTGSIWPTTIHLLNTLFWQNYSSPEEAKKYLQENITWDSINTLKKDFLQNMRKLRLIWNENLFEGKWSSEYSKIINDNSEHFTHLNPQQKQFIENCIGTNFLNLLFIYQSFHKFLNDYTTKSQDTMIINQCKDKFQRLWKNYMIWQQRLPFWKSFVRDFVLNEDNFYKTLGINKENKPSEYMNFLRQYILPTLIMNTLFMLDGGPIIAEVQENPWGSSFANEANTLVRFVDIYEASDTKSPNTPIISNTINTKSVKLSISKNEIDWKEYFCLERWNPLDVLEALARVDSSLQQVLLREFDCDKRELRAAMNQNKTLVRSFFLTKDWNPLFPIINNKPDISKRTTWTIFTIKDSNL